MHILFVIPPVERGNKIWAIYPPLGIMYMSSLLKQEGHRVSFIDGTSKITTPLPLLRQCRPSAPICSGSASTPIR